MRSLHDLAIKQDWVAPVDFWKMTPGQLWWMIEAKLPDEIVTRQSDHAAIREMIDRAKEAEENV